MINRRFIDDPRIAFQLAPGSTPITGRGKIRTSFQRNREKGYRGQVRARPSLRIANRERMDGDPPRRKIPLCSDAAEASLCLACVSLETGNKIDFVSRFAFPLVPRLSEQIVRQRGAEAEDFRKRESGMQKESVSDERRRVHADSRIIISLPLVKAR